MRAEDLARLRHDLSLNQSDMARALNVSFATLNRWEKKRRPIPNETVRLLECLRAVANSAKRGKTAFSLNDLRDAVSATGIAGVVGLAASAGFIAPTLVAALSITVPFAWIGAVAGVGAAVALPFFKKLNGKNTVSARRRKSTRKNNRKDTRNDKQPT
jgi:transcriptional regulator with XRE-family HTH domain